MDGPMRSVAYAAAVGVAVLLVVSGAALALPGHAATPITAGGSAGLVTDARPLPPKAVPVPLDPAQRISVTLTLPFANGSRLNPLLTAVEDPVSPDYRHFLTEPQFVAEFGPTPGQVDQVRSVLEGAGATSVEVSGSRTTVTALVTAGAVDRLFGVDLVAYGSQGRWPLYTALGTPTVPASLDGLVVGVGGLSDSANPALTLNLARAPLLPVHGGSGQFVLNNTTEWFIGSDYTQAYRATDLFPNGALGANGTFPTRVAIATLLASGYNESADENLPGWDPAVVGAYFNDTFPSYWPHPGLAGVPVDIDGISAPAPASFGSLNDSSLDEFENSLDLEMAGSMAPGASLYNFYFAGSLLAGAGPVGDLADYFAADLTAALDYNYSPEHLGVVTGSFGLPDLNDSAWNADLTEAALTGVTVVMASGDQGNAPDNLTGRGDGQWPVWPASASFNTTGSVAVGGVSIGLDGVPTTTFNGTSLNVTFDSNLTGFSSMSTWWDTGGCPTACAGTEGGLSLVYPEPYWQFHSAAQPNIVAAALVQGASSLGRAEPDFAFPANNTIAYVYADADENIYFAVLEGTSIAAPVFAGLLADVVAVENLSGLPQGLGYLDPQLYRMASYFAANPGPGSPFLDVTAGSNYVFSAGVGWDATTGWGGLDTPLFLAADRNQTIAQYQYTGPTPGLPAPASSSIPDLAVYVILGLAIVLAILLVFVFAGPRRRGLPPPAPSYGPPGTTYGVAPPAPLDGYPLPPPAPDTVGQTSATFLCPYCGSVRPAEPVRCPRCGAL